ncbi:MAG: hypothetical protein L3K13_07800 [Thermoplasmata archaeon]|nr:hypothetical protein [Thermoplasmata archaeon]
MDTRPKAVLTPKEVALASLDRTMEPFIRTWKQATHAHAQAKADLAEAAYNKALDAASAKYEAWCKLHHETP